MHQISNIDIRAKIRTMQIRKKKNQKACGKCMPSSVCTPTKKGGSYEKRKRKKRKTLNDERRTRNLTQYPRPRSHCPNELPLLPLPVQFALNPPCSELPSPPHIGAESLLDRNPTTLVPGPTPIPTPALVGGGGVPPVNDIGEASLTSSPTSLGTTSISSPTRNPISDPSLTLSASVRARFSTRPSSSMSSVSVMLGCLGNRGPRWL